MARVMSLAFIVFLAVPIAAPSLGQFINLFAPWPYIFGVLTVFAIGVTFWVYFRLPETLHPEDRLAIQPGRIVSAFKLTLTNRTALGYMLAMAVMLGSLFGFINSAQQVFADVFKAPTIFPVIFGFVAAFMAVSSYLNSRIVEGIGTHKVSHLALLFYVAIAIVHAFVSWTGHESVVTFTILQAAMMFAFGLVVSNFGSMAMEPLGHVAGTASSVQGFVTTFGGALLGFYIGQHFDGTSRPMTFGFAACGVVALVIVLITERGRLFQGDDHPIADAGFAH
ncbi:MAG: multidrug effflux transporter, partial [Rhizobacter sp.]|nr:multidrug effflux transporter [Rhizobacter sp.]